MREITGIHRLIIYNTGEMEIEKMPTDYLFTPIPTQNFPPASSHISQRAHQTTRVLQEIKAGLSALGTSSSTNLFEWKVLVSDAIKKVAEELVITQPSVADKITRRLGIGKDSFVSLVESFFNGGYDTTTYTTSDLYQTIRKALTTPYDVQYVQDGFKSILL